MRILVSFNIDVVVDAVGKKTELGRDELRRIVDAEVALPAVLWSKIMVAHLVAQRTFVLSVGTELADVGCAEASRQVDTDIPTIGEVINGPKTARDACEMSAERLEIEFVGAFFLLCK